jgi:hypothetical protein
MILEKSLRFLCVLCVSAVLNNASLRKPQRPGRSRGSAEKKAKAETNLK